MVYGGVRVAALLYTLWPILAGPFCLPTFLICGAHLDLAPSRVSTGTREGWVGVASRLTLQPTRGQTLGVCVFVCTDH